MRSVRYERVQRALEALLGTPITGWSMTGAWRKNPSDLAQWVRVYRVRIRQGKDVLVDIDRLTFRAPRWGYGDWTPIFQHASFFSDLYATGHELEPWQRHPGAGERRTVLQEYLDFRWSLGWHFTPRPASPK